MRRRGVLIGAGALTAVGSASFPTPAIAQGIRELKMVTDWPENTPGLQSSAIRPADWQPADASKSTSFHPAH